MPQIKLKPLRPTPHSLPVSSQQGLILNSVCPSRTFPSIFTLYFFFSILAVKTLKILFVFTLKILIRFFFWCLEIIQIFSLLFASLPFLPHPLPPPVLLSIGILFLFISIIQTQLFVVVQTLSHVRLFATPWTAASQASLSFTISQSLLKLMSIESVMPSNHLTLCCPLLLPPSVFSSIRVFSKESVLRVAKVLEFQFQHQSFQ